MSHSGASELTNLMEGTTAGALLQEIMHLGLQDLLESGVSSLTGPSSMRAALFSDPPISTAIESG